MAAEPGWEKEETIGGGSNCKAISKFLTHNNPSRPNWRKLLKPKEIRSYVDHLDATGASEVDGQLTFLQRIDLAIKYLKLEIIPVHDQRNFSLAGRVQERVLVWRGSLMPSKWQKGRLRWQRTATTSRPRGRQLL